MKRSLLTAIAIASLVCGPGAGLRALAHPVNINPQALAATREPSSDRERETPHFTADRDIIMYRIAPALADPSIQRYLKDDYVIYSRSATKQAQLLVFMPGTGGQPSNVQLFLATAAQAGYRAIGLEYDDLPAVSQTCPNDPDPTCSGRFREKRIFGTDDTNDVDDSPGESIVARLTKLLVYLDAQHPKDGWGAYLSAGAPDWSRIAVAGHSQGAGMAAFIAKRVAVARVIMFSSPWDFFGDRTPAPWLSGSSETPIDRWYGFYHKKEHFAAAIARAYAALGLDAAHIRVLSAEPQPRSAAAAADLYHTSTVGDFTTPLDERGPAYEDDWSWALGQSP